MKTTIAMFMLWVILAFLLFGCAKEIIIKPDPERDKSYYLLGRNAGIMAYARLETRQLETGRKFTIDEVLMMADSLAMGGGK